MDVSSMMILEKGKKGRFVYYLGLQLIRFLHGQCKGAEGQGQAEYMGLGAMGGAQDHGLKGTSYVYKRYGDMSDAKMSVFCHI